MHTELRTEPINRVYLHTNEGPQRTGAAHDLADYLQHIDGGYHVIVDDQATVWCAPDNVVLWSQGGDNRHSLSVCLIGYAHFTAADWSTPYSKAEIERAAQVVAHWCKLYDIPAVHVRPGAPGEAPTDRGIAEHADDHAYASEGHTDPGTGFPIDAFVKRVNVILNPVLDPAVVSALAAIAAWGQRVSAKPLRVNQVRKDVTLAKKLLAAKGYDVGNTLPRYGQAFVKAVHAYKVDHGWKDPDGTGFGARMVKSLLS